MIFSYCVTEVQTLKTFLYQQRFSKKTISAIKQHGALLVNQQPRTVRHLLQVGDEVIVRLPDEIPSTTLIPFNQPLRILYEDTWLLIVAKPAHQNSAPSREHPHESLVEQALAHMQRRKETGIPHIVTRLDRHTMGIVVIAKSRHVHHVMTLTAIEKIYECLCVGRITASGVIEAPIGRASDSIINRIVTKEGKYAKTLYTPIQTTGDYSWCRVTLLTGRTHQIRVHFQHIGHSIVGDGLYGVQHHHYDTQLLKCAEIKFIHPITDDIVHVKSETPDFGQILTTL
ncbi:MULTISPECIES: RluA family pseudouridine synthase [unclassified Staphylococcus]|uniref:RluA family pseudouridine synthase n=1 Tax=unclassified Staphylococcus TaxID=91994 RepID=UPI0021CE0027|nr:MULTISPECIES: RluA family pseudouridine synthase [unclassified Staphylococcus]UXR78890.1 RluA family pseudouridine synthase [Staphylococcus sp. IVB6227]UXR83051.1 RluA family pseudouridine synthase [Staphylococcus sp. IVB6214]